MIHTYFPLGTLLDTFCLPLSARALRLGGTPISFTNLSLDNVDRILNVSLLWFNIFQYL